MFCRSNQTDIYQKFRGKTYPIILIQLINGRQINEFEFYQLSIVVAFLKCSTTHCSSQFLIFVFIRKITKTYPEPQFSDGRLGVRDAAEGEETTSVIIHHNLPSHLPLFHVDHKICHLPDLITQLLPSKSEDHKIRTPLVGIIKMLIGMYYDRNSTEFAVRRRV